MTNLEMYINFLKGDKKSLNTITAYHQDLCQFLSIVDKEECDITYADLLMYKSAISNMSSATVNRKIVAVKNYLQFLVDIDILNSNVGTKLKNVKIENKVKTYIPMDEAVKLIDYGKNPRDRAILALYLSTGLRVSEVINMKISDYNSDKIILKTKGDKDRVLFLNEQCRTYIDKYLQCRKNVDIDNLFVSNQGTPMNAIALNRTIKNIAKKSGFVGSVSNHSFRHTFVSKICDEYGVTTACEIVNHSNINTTMRYCHSTEQTIKNVMEQVRLG